MEYYCVAINYIINNMKKQRTFPRGIRFPEDLQKIIEEHSKLERRSFGMTVIKIVEDHYKAVNNLKDIIK